MVALAVADLARDIAAVTGRTPRVLSAGQAGGRTAVWVGTLGHSRLIDGLARRGRLDVRPLKGAWESYVIATVDKPAPGLDSVLVIVGSDRRGTAYGVYELSQAIGVSPWAWWADVPPRRREAVYVDPGPRRFGPPSVKYRGIFLNDEDWGLQPWAAGTFDPALGDIGPKTYAKLFELLLRLKANTLWPAMHAVTQAFNLYPDNPRLADDHAIVMGSSHAEPMLRNNVTEWTGPAADFDYAKNPAGVRDYWRRRVAANGRYENIYTLGIRGIHDSGMAGAATVADQKRLLKTIFADQRRLLAEHVDPKVERVPQVFTPYKEVLEVYRAGLAVPDDVTLVWPDDNFGYIRQLPDAVERRRSGGSGVYYHLSYLGAPLSYIWLATTPPALIWEEMGKAYDHGAKTLWIANVGDLKPAEIGTEFFLAMAWDIDRWKAGPDAFLRAWAARDFGPDHAEAIADILKRHYALNFERRPEHLQWWLPGQKPRPSDLSLEAAAARLARFDALTRDVEALERAVAPERQDALFELVGYPVKAAALANHRVFDTEAYDRLFNSQPMEARRRGAQALAADQALAALTARYGQIAGGKWRGLMAAEPADGQWKSFRLSPPVLPAANLVAAVPPRAPAEPEARPAAPAPLVIEAEAFAGRVDRPDARWGLIEGLGRGQGAMAIAPTTAASVSLAEAGQGPRLDYGLTPEAGTWRLRLELIPTFPLAAGRGLRLAVSLDDGPPRLVEVARPLGDAAWAQGVLSNRLSVETGLEIAGGATHKLSLMMIDPGVVVDSLTLTR